MQKTSAQALIFSAIPVVLANFHSYNIVAGCIQNLFYLLKSVRNKLFVPEHEKENVYERI